MSQQNDVLISMEARDNASQKIDDATTRINKAWKDMRNEQRVVQREFELTNQRLVAFSRVTSTVGYSVNRMLSLYNTWNILNIRVQDSNRNVRDSLRALNDAFVEFGPDSKQFQDRLQDYQDTLKEQERTQRDVMVGYAFMITSMIADSVRITTSIIPRLRVLSRTIRGIPPIPAAATGAAVAASPAFPAAAGATAAGAAAGAGIASKVGILAKGSGIVAGGAIGATLIESAFPDNPVTRFRDETLTPAARGAEKAVGDIITKTYNFIVNTDDPNSAGRQILNAIRFYD